MSARTPIILLPMLALLALAGPVRAAEGDPERGRALFQVCQGCHGAQGEGNEAQGAPRLAGQHGWYLRRQLMNFRQGIRGASEQDQYGQLMRGFASLLEDEQAVHDVVAYIETLSRD